MDINQDIVRSRLEVRRSSILDLVDVSDEQEVVIVDNFAIGIEVMSKLLLSKGYKVTTLCNADALMDFFNERYYEFKLLGKLPILIVESDLVQMSGFDATKQVKESFPEIKVIMLSCDNNTQLNSSSHFVDRFLTKPVFSNEVDAAIKALL
ncbi:two-component response regulator ARR-A family [Acrasis kona]|uniref:Two-component response regulator ARR-A family n=1 Tax=Acrasis kona TaxID=1008807 RepID=A0AAW2ZJ93_9EUKA